VDGGHKLASAAYLALLSRRKRRVITVGKNASFSPSVTVGYGLLQVVEKLHIRAGRDCNSNYSKLLRCVTGNGG